MIQFTDHTVAEELKEPSCIVKEKFWFRSHEDFEAHVDANEDLYDALGKIVVVNDEESDLDSAKGMIGIHLHLENGPVVRVTFWTGVAKQFRDARAKLPAAPQVLLATAINPRRLGGVLYLNSTFAIRFFFDDDVEPNSKYLTWLNDNKKVGGAVDFPASAVTKLELVSITINTFLTSKSPQVVSTFRKKSTVPTSYKGQQLPTLFHACKNTVASPL